MSEILRAHLLKFIDLEENDFAGIIDLFEKSTVARKKNLLAAGKICRSNYFVEKGCLRMYFINKKGNEQTIQFAIENWWLADYASFSVQKPSEFFIQVVENSEILSIDFRAYAQLLEKFPVMEKYFRLIHQRAHAAAQFRIRNLYEFSREELYHHFNESYPEFVQRIPQYLLASYLGFTPEYLSEIRKKKLS